MPPRARDSAEPLGRSELLVKMGMPRRAWICPARLHGEEALIASRDEESSHGVGVQWRRRIVVDKDRNASLCLGFRLGYGVASAAPTFIEPAVCNILSGKGKGKLNQTEKHLT